MAVSVAPVITVLVSHPFNVPKGSAPCDRHARKRRMAALASALNSCGRTEWSLFDIEGILPRVMAKRKGVILRTTESDSPRLLDIITEHNKGFEVFRQIVSVKHSAYYWDAGLGAVDHVISIRILKPHGLTSLYGVIEAYVNSLNEMRLILPPGYDTWVQFGNDFASALHIARISAVHWLTRNDSKNYTLETSQWGLLISEKNGGISVSRDILATALEEFCGDKTTDMTFDVGVSEFIATHVNYSGCACIVKENDDSVEERVMWLWRTVALLYGALLESAEPLYNTTVNLVTFQLEGTRQPSFDVRSMRFMIDLLENEAKPVIICSESFDAAIYEAIWDSWGGDDVQEAIDARMNFLADSLNDIASLRSADLSMRLNIVVFVLTIVSITSTVSAVIGVLDTSGSLDPAVRSLWLGLTTGIAGLACALGKCFSTLVAELFVKEQN